MPEHGFYGKCLLFCYRNITNTLIILSERVGMVPKAAEYYLTNLAKKRSGKSWKNDTQVMY